MPRRRRLAPRPRERFRRASHEHLRDRVSVFELSHRSDAILPPDRNAPRHGHGRVRDIERAGPVGTSSPIGPRVFSLPAPADRRLVVPGGSHPVLRRISLPNGKTCVMDSHSPYGQPPYSRSSTDVPMDHPFFAATAPTPPTPQASPAPSSAPSRACRAPSPHGRAGRGRAGRLAVLRRPRVGLHRDRGRPRPHRRQPVPRSDRPHRQRRRRGRRPDAGRIPRRRSHRRCCDPRQPGGGHDHSRRASRPASGRSTCRRPASAPASSFARTAGS